MRASGRGLTTLFIATLVAIMAGGCVYWLIGLQSSGWREAPDSDSILQTYTDGLANGQTSLSIKPDRRLLELPNPYDPEANQGYRVLDASLYAGKYYSYFGVIPFVFLFVPWLKLTGSHLTAKAAIWLFTALGLAAYNLAIWVIWRRWFFATGIVWLVVALLAVTVGSAIWPLVMLSRIYSVLCAAGYAVFAVAVLCLILSETNIAGRVGWQIAALTAAGLVMGCRPNYLPAVATLSVSVGWRMWTAWRPPGRRALAFCLAFTPLVLIAVALAAWNYIRFHNPLEFGFRYQLITQNRPEAGYLSLSNVAYNLHRYLAGLPRCSAYFPFFQGEAPGPFALPLNHEPTSFVYGALWMCPVLLLGLGWLAPIRAKLPAALGRIVAVVSGAALGNLILLAMVGNGAARYEVDFLAPFSLVTGSAIMAFATTNAVALRRSLLMAAGGLTALTGANQLCWATSLWPDFELARPRDFAVMAKPFNAMVYALEEWRGDGPRGITLGVKLPENRFGAVEPLVIVGSQSAQDFLYLVYVGRDELRLGFEATGRGGPVSRLIHCDYGRPHRVKLDYGSFLPPADHRLFDGISPTDIQLSRRRLTVSFDGQPVLDGWVDFHPVKALVFVGESPFDDAFGSKFTGKILAVEHPRLVFSDLAVERTRTEGFGPVELKLSLTNLPKDSLQPLVMVGQHNQGEALLLRALGDSRFQVGWQHFQGSEQWGQPFSNVNSNSVVHVTWGALLPPPGSRIWSEVPAAEASAMKSKLQVEIDGQKVLEIQTQAFDAAPSTVAFGENSLELSGVAARFGGNIESHRRLQWK